MSTNAGKSQRGKSVGAASEDSDALRLAREKKLLEKLTPGGKIFARRLDKSLSDEFSLLSCNAGDLIRAHILEDHLRTVDSIDALNDLSLRHAKARVTAYYMIMNHASILLRTGRLHRCQGRLSEMGEQVFQVWQMYAYRLADLGIEDMQGIERERGRLLEAVGKLGKGSAFSLMDAVKSLFGKKVE